MAKHAITYLDVTQDPAAGPRAIHAPEMARTLYEMGFRRVGLVESRGDPAQAAVLRRTFSSEDAELLARAVEEGEVDEVMYAEDASAFAVVERFVAGPLISFQSILDNGVVIETTMKPARAPRLRGASAQSGTSRESLLTKFVIGPPPLWGRADQPRSGYFVELVDTRSAAVLWQQHQQRVTEKTNLYQTRLRAQASLPVYLAIHKRFRETQERQGQQGQRLLKGFTLLLMALVAFFTLYHARNLLDPNLLFILIARLLLAGLVSLLLMVVFIRLVIPNLPVPLTPLDTLINLPE